VALPINRSVTALTCASVSKVNRSDAVSNLDIREALPGDAASISSLIRGLSAKYIAHEKKMVLFLF
jgi:hypothetical protein